MKDIQAIAALYEQADNYLETLCDTEETAGGDAERDRVTHKQRINDQAYFVLAWGQLEAEIEEACRDAIRHGLRHGDWRHRRAWTLYNPDDPRLSGLSFQSRLTLVVDKDSDEWKKTLQHYNVRNHIAHGNLVPERIDVSSVVQDFLRIQSSLARD